MLGQGTGGVDDDLHAGHALCVIDARNALRRLSRAPAQSDRLHLARGGHVAAA
jgi:hypothetical protein